MPLIDSLTEFASKVSLSLASLRLQTFFNNYMDGRCPLVESVKVWVRTCRPVRSLGNPAVQDLISSELSLRRQTPGFLLSSGSIFPVVLHMTSDGLLAIEPYFPEVFQDVANGASSDFKLKSL